MPKSKTIFDMALLNRYYGLFVQRVKDGCYRDIGVDWNYRFKDAVLRPRFRKPKPDRFGYPAG